MANDDDQKIYSSSMYAGKTVFSFSVRYLNYNTLAGEKATVQLCAPLDL